MASSSASCSLLNSAMWIAFAVVHRHDCAAMDLAAAVDVGGLGQETQGSNSFS